MEFEINVKVPRSLPRKILSLVKEDCVVVNKKAFAEAALQNWLKTAFRYEDRLAEEATDDLFISGLIEKLEKCNLVRRKKQRSQLRSRNGPRTR